MLRTSNSYLGRTDPGRGPTYCGDRGKQSSKVPKIDDCYVLGVILASGSWLDHFCGTSRRMVAVVAFMAPSFVLLSLWSAFLGEGGGFVWLHLQEEGDREGKGGS